MSVAKVARTNQQQWGWKLTAAALSLKYLLSDKLRDLVKTSYLEQSLSCETAS